MKKTILVFATVAAVALLAGCSSYGTPTNNNVQAPSNAGAQNTPVSGSAVAIQGFAFNPATLTVKAGTTVTWTNMDSVPHQIKSATFNSGQLGQGQSFSFKFDTAGTFDYSCAIHPSMLGKIVVQ